MVAGVDYLPPGMAGVGGPRVDELTAQIGSTDEARKLLDLADRRLAQAMQLTAGVQAAGGARTAARELVAQVLNFSSRVRQRLPWIGPMAPDVTGQVALVVVQAEDALRAVDEATQGSLTAEFLEGARTILNTTHDRILGGDGFNLPRALGLPPWVVPTLVIGGAVGLGVWAYVNFLRPAGKAARARWQP